MRVRTIILVGWLVLGLFLLTAPAGAQNASITLTPTSGIAAVTIRGTGFSVWSGITIYWEGAVVPAIMVDTGEQTSFTAIISVPTQTSPGLHQVMARDGYGEQASAFFNVVDMTGPTGPTGPAGISGQSCWDLDGDGIADAEEDTNGDGQVNVYDCRGTAGVNCWDLDGDGVPDASEDANGDGVVDVLDCQGPPGEGISVPGAPGAPGINCWDTNQNGIKDPSEDINGDGVVDVLDCRGEPGPAGPEGQAGSGVIWQGPWNEDFRYAVGDAVEYQGSAYLALAASVNAPPPDSPEQWQLMVARGAPGEPGEKGDTGAAGSTGTAGFVLSLVALILIAAGKVKKWILP